MEPVFKSIVWLKANKNEHRNYPPAIGFSREQKEYMQGYFQGLPVAE
jgi:hypothetical protein